LPQEVLDRLDADVHSQGGTNDQAFVRSLNSRLLPQHLANYLVAIELEEYIQASAGLKVER
jgi:hypothetical protein